MKSKKQRETKMKLEDIPPVGTAGRQILLRITDQPEYNKAVNSGIPGFNMLELNSIERKYKQGMKTEEIFKELKKKGWHVKPNTIKHYIQVGQLPKSTEPREKTDKGAISLYPSNFMRHLNIVRFAMNAGKNTWNSITDSMYLKTDYDLLEEATSDSCYQEFSGCFFNAIWVGLQDIEEGIDYGVEAVEKAFKNNVEKRKKYRKRINNLKKLFEKVEKEATDFNKDAKEAGLGDYVKIKDLPDSIFNQ